MENYHYLNQKTELSTNQDKLFLQFNKNLQYQNFFRGDSNINKQKGKIYYINNKKEIHFTTRAKDNEISTNGPKMLTMNFPPGFMMNDNNNNSRKTASHEKNIYMQQNMANNMELNDIGSDNEKIFSNTVKKGFQDYNENNQEKKNINNLIQKQKVMSIKLNNNKNMNNIQKKNFFYNGSGSSGIVLNSINNLGYNRSETELKSGRGNSSNEKDKNKNFINHIRTEGSDFDIQKNTNNGGNINYKSNNNIPFNIYINNNQNNKTTSNIIYNYNFDSDNNNNYSSNNSNNSKDRVSINNSYGQKDSLKGTGSSSNSKLVYNPSSISNQRMIKKGSDSELYSSSINHKYVANKKYNKEFKQLNNHLSYSNINDNVYKKNYYYYNNKSENNSKLSPSQEKNSNSQSREKNNTKTQTDFEKNNRPNYYENLIYELNKLPNGSSSQININSAFEYNNNILENFALKKKIDNLNIGIPYKLYNGYKFYFNIPNEQIYILKEVSYSQGKGIISMIDEWNNNFGNDSIYLKIYDHEIDSNQRQIIWVMQYPTGGESLNDIINSMGFYDQNYLFDIVTKIYKTIMKLNEGKNKKIERFRNVPFCLCDIFMNVNDNIKIIPPLMRQIPIKSNTNNNSNSKNNIISQCKCKTNILLLQILFNINKDSISFFCLGFLIIQMITQNLIFELNSYKYIFKKIKMNMNKINMSSLFTLQNMNKNIYFSEKKCCFVHLLLDIEKQKLNGSEYLLFSHFLNLYPKSLLSFLHECMSFNNIIPSSSNEFLNLYDTNKNLNLSIKEILEITTLPKNDYIKFDVFLSDFEMLYKDGKINYDDYIRKLNTNKVIQVLSRAFGIDKEKFLNSLSQKIENNNNDVNNYDSNVNKDKENEIFRDIINNNNNYENISSLFIGYNKKKDNDNISNNIFNKKNDSRKLTNQRSSDNYEYI